jgi:hypothetical protein
LKILPPKLTLTDLKTPLDRELAGEEPDIRLTDEIPLLICGFISAVAGFVRKV